ncbi:Auxin-responsive GH3 family protein [Hibiscus syriacus]|uniref:Auxin-responsive GH3 family protein n=1 Tax=Hibiscus syriacus TaxID=106335 RepID=A0A6A2XFR3_HIBSY|nr:Auxin-responsive GH3 family protein [Hibiscus syriacus]
MGVSPSQAKGEEENHVFPEQSTSQQSHEIGSEYLLTQLSENKNQRRQGITQNESPEFATGASCSTIQKPSSEHVAKGTVREHNHTQSFCPRETVSKNKETLENKHQCDSENVQNKLEESCTWAKQSKPLSKGFSENAITDSLGLSPKDSSKYIRTNKLSCLQQGSAETTVGFESRNICKELCEYTNKRNHGKGLKSPSEDENNVTQTRKSSPADPLGLPQEFASGDPSIQQPGSILKKYMLRSLSCNDRVLASNPQEKSKPGESSNNLGDASPNEQQKRRKNKRREKREGVDEYSRIRRHLRYFLNRINYERSLILAYSADSWKGLSHEKLKPEKELQRATSEIHRCKSKIRDQFQQIDSLCAEGRLPESLFDSEGQIDSEDIFCAKCGSKDLSPDNDIILCDGACDRGFHQYCLQPALLKEGIPPDDEGWLCPGCNCKVDCIQLLNESQGTCFSLTDNWEKVFPEAALLADGENLDPNLGLASSDDSDENDYNLDDNDYNPDGSETSEKDEEDDSDESDFTCTRSEEMEETANGSDDDNVAHRVGSNSEDLGIVLEDDSMSEYGGKESLNDELLSIMESASGQDDDDVSKKRSNGRLDYKRLYDETYGNVPSSSSDDEEWSYATIRRKRLKCSTEEANGNASEEVAATSGSSGKNSSSSTHRRLGEAVKQRLYESFKENQYPDRSTKENLAKELEITFQQVSKWFCNARWNYCLN